MVYFCSMIVNIVHIQIAEKKNFPVIYLQTAYQWSILREFFIGNMYSKGKI